ncbi:MAG: hypothetical protein JOZ22_19450 [Acidobacteriia bacterium]|nr:hypothetical protein [Terriglobia bacterium]
MTFNEKQCSTVDMSLQPSPCAAFAAALMMDGSVRILCVTGDARLFASVHFERCGR